MPEPLIRPGERARSMAPGAARVPRVAVFDADYPSTLATVGSLARAGVPLVAYHHRPHSALRYSRYIDRVRACPDICDYARFAAWLADRLAAGAFDIVAPTSDVLCYHLAGIAEQLPGPYRAGLPTRAALLDVLFKDRFAAACQRLGIATPATRAPTSLDAALADADTLGYPLLLKPRTHVGVPCDRGARIDNAAQLRARFRPYAFGAREQCLLDAHPRLAWPLLQEYIDVGRPQLSCSGVLDAHGRLIAGGATVKLDQSPAATGTGTAFASRDDATLVDRCSSVAARLLGRGLFEIEVLARSDREPPLVIDVNPRVFGQIGFDIARGHDLPALWYAAMRGAVAAPAPPRQDVVCVYPGPFVLANVTRIVTGPRRWRRLRRFVRLLARARCATGWHWRDPLAALVVSLRPLRHPTTFIRSHIRERRDARSGG